MNKLYNNNSNNIISKTIGTVLVCFMLVGLAAYGVYYNIEANKSKQIIQNQYQRAFADMSNYVNQAENYLLKAMAAGTPGLVSEMLEHACECSAQAESCLASLPINQQSTEKISNYLVQLGDIANCWSHRAVNGGKLTENEYETLSALYGYAQDLSGVIYTLGNNLSDNSFNWNKMDKSTLKRISEPFTDYPELNYKGKFSSHISNSEAKCLIGYNMQKEDCRGYATKYFNKICSCPAEEIGFEYCGENSYQNIETYCFTMSCAENISAHIDVTKKCGLLYSMIIDRKIGNINLSPEQGIEAGKGFLKSIGLNNMTVNTYSTDGETVTVNYVYEKNGIIYYPDAVNVKIALDNGTPIAYEAHKYITSHYESKSRVSKANISVNDARELLSTHFDAKSVKEVIVEGAAGDEYHAYEFKGMVSGHPVLVYVNADNGTESDILLLYESEQGMLSI